MDLIVVWLVLLITGPVHYSTANILLTIKCKNSNNMNAISYQKSSKRLGLFLNINVDRDMLSP